MKAQELRIGNRIMDGGIVKTVTTGMLSNWETLDKHPYDGYKPIPLDEQWLERFGLTKPYNDRYGVKRTFPYKMLDGVIKQRNGVYFFKHGTLEVELPYVHTLQNLYYALKNEERRANIKHIMKTKKALSDVSMFRAYKEDTAIEIGTRVICVSDDDFSVIKGSYGVTLESSNNPYVRWENTDFRKSTIGNDNGSTWACYSYLLAPFPDELYNKLVLGNVLNVEQEDNAKDERIWELETLLDASKTAHDITFNDLKTAVTLLKAFHCNAYGKEDMNITNVLIAKYAPRKQYTLEQLREKIGEDFDIVKDGEI